MRVADFSFDLPDELIAQYGGAARRVAAARPGAARAGRLGIGTFATCRTSFGPAICWSSTTRACSRRACSDAACRAAARSSACCSAHAIDREPGGSARFEALVHPGQKLKPGARVRFEGAAGGIDGEILERRFFGRRVVRLTPDAGHDLDALVDAIGHVPLPPYIHRGDEAADRERYQTVYAHDRGSVAAPTAGLHFTPELLDTIAARGVDPRRRSRCTSATAPSNRSAPTSSKSTSSIREPYQISRGTAEAIALARAEGRRVIAVGTTTTRALEDAAVRGEGVVRRRPGAGRDLHPPGLSIPGDRGPPDQLPPARSRLC